MTDKGLLEALSDDDTHSGDLAGEQPLAVQGLILQAQILKEKGWLLLQHNDQELDLSRLNITPEGAGNGTEPRRPVRPEIGLREFRV